MVHIYQKNKIRLSKYKFQVVITKANLTYGTELIGPYMHTPTSIVYFIVSVITSEIKQ